MKKTNRKVVNKRKKTITIQTKQIYKKRIIEQIRFGPVPTKSIDYNVNKIYDKKSIREFVKNTIEEYMDYVVTLPVPPYTHTFYISLLEKGKIMVSDIGGKDNAIKGIKKVPSRSGRTEIDNPLYQEKYINYSIFIQELQTKYPSKTIEYYPLDDELNQKARSNPIYLKYNTGACAEYLYDWLKKHVN